MQAGRLQPLLPGLAEDFAGAGGLAILVQDAGLVIEASRGRRGGGRLLEVRERLGIVLGGEVDHASRVEQFGPSAHACDSLVDRLHRLDVFFVVQGQQPGEVVQSDDVVRLLVQYLFILFNRQIVLAAPVVQVGEVQVKDGRRGLLPYALDEPRLHRLDLGVGRIHDPEQVHAHRAQRLGHDGPFIPRLLAQAERIVVALLPAVGADDQHHLFGLGPVALRVMDEQRDGVVALAARLEEARPQFDAGEAVGGRFRLLLDLFDPADDLLRLRQSFGLPLAQ